VNHWCSWEIIGHERRELGAQVELLRKKYEREKAKEAYRKDAHAEVV